MKNKPKDRKEKCKHCKGDIDIRNPKGICDHLYYPSNCDVCMKPKKRREKMTNYYTQLDGEWVRPKPGYKMACCDCGLVHKIYFRLRKSKVEFKAFRDNRATGQRRRYLTQKK